MRRRRGGEGLAYKEFVRIEFYWLILWLVARLLGLNPRKHTVARMTFDFSNCRNYKSFRKN